MTVQRHQTEFFGATCPEVAVAVRTVLSRCPPYVRMAETEGGSVFETNVRPSWWLLGTDMTIELQPTPTGTQVVAQTKSQWFIYGDVFDYYNRYLRDFLRAVRAELQSHET